MHKIARALKRPRKEWWALVPLLVAFMAAGLAVSVRHHGQIPAAPSAALERQQDPVGPDHASPSSEWGWEWQPDLDPSTIDGPIHLR